MGRRARVEDVASRDPDSAPEGKLEFVAYDVNPALSMPLVTAPAQRDWMEATDVRFANRCLPLLIANQSGWFVLSAHTVRAVWLGGSGLDRVKVEHLGGHPPYSAASHFGHGILTFSLPYLFRTSPGYNLLVRGPANRPKDGASALEGVVETDWCPATFTMNWQLTRTNTPVTFEQGEPIAMLVLQRRGELEAVLPEVRALGSDRDELRRYQEWSRSRSEFLSELRRPGSEAIEQKWQKDYFQGSNAGRKVREHQTKLKLRSFARSEPNSAKLGTPPETVPRAARPSQSPVVPVASGDRLAEVVVVERSIDDATCRRLVELHRRFGMLTTTSDNGLYLPLVEDRDPEGYALALAVVERIRALIEERFGTRMGCDLALLCAVTAGGFRHVLHADNAKVVCPAHGDDAEHLVRVGCSCDDVTVQPNHTPWRRFSAQVWLGNEHTGGKLVLGAGPNVYAAYRKEIEPAPGLLVLTPSNEHHFRHTTPVESGTCYSLDTWFTDDPAHVGAEFG